MDARHLTDLENAQRFALAFQEDLKYARTARQWFVWDGARWNKDQTGEANRRAKDFTRKLYDAADAISDSGKRAALIKAAKNAQSASRIASLLELARTEPGIAIAPGEFDRNPGFSMCRTEQNRLVTSPLSGIVIADISSRKALTRIDRAEAQCMRYIITAASCEGSTNRPKAQSADRWCMERTVVLCTSVDARSAEEGARDFILEHSGNHRRAWSQGPALMTTRYWAFVASLAAIGLVVGWCLASASQGPPKNMHAQERSLHPLKMSHQDLLGLLETIREYVEVANGDYHQAAEGDLELLNDLGQSVRISHNSIASRSVTIDLPAVYRLRYRYRHPPEIDNIVELTLDLDDSSRRVKVAGSARPLVNGLHAVIAEELRQHRWLGGPHVRMIVLVLSLAMAATAFVKAYKTYNRDGISGSLPFLPAGIVGVAILAAIPLDLLGPLFPGIAVYGPPAWFFEKHQVAIGLFVALLAWLTWLVTPLMPTRKPR